MTRARLLGALFALVALVGCNDSALPPGGTYQRFSGVVVDSVTNRPIAGAVVTVDTVLTQTTGEDGKFSFPEVPVGEVDYEVRLPGGAYKVHRNSAHLSPDKPLTVTVALSH